jgi:hypothetical protein
LPPRRGVPGSPLERRRKLSAGKCTLSYLSVPRAGGTKNVGKWLRGENEHHARRWSA